MNELKLKIHDKTSELDYILDGDYYIPAIELAEGDDLPIGKGGGCTATTTSPLLNWRRAMTFPLEKGADAQGIFGKNKSTPTQPLDSDEQATYLPC